ncbi:ATP-binding protein [Myxococcus sp. SDU36]|uniref:ATP-binding protein n=1 Tax=Myxococcus sp. SDU36 TaxID=2831967 RepID=UPI0025426C69|nr:ATP-binding protein [Myxococcus sp. SDU36]
MLVEQTLEKLNAMKLYGMANYLRSWVERPGDKGLGASDLVGLLADAEWMYRENKKLTSRLQHAKLRQQACLEDIDYAHARGLTKPQVLELSTSKWVADKQNVLLTGPTGVGKSFLACALGQKACRDGYSVVYRRACWRSSRSAGIWSSMRSSRSAEFGSSAGAGTESSQCKTASLPPRLRGAERGRWAAVSSGDAQLFLALRCARDSSAMRLR